MSTLEATVSMLEDLTEDQLICIQGFAQRFTHPAKTTNPYKPLSEDELLSKLAISRAHEAEGRTKSAAQSVSDIRVKYGLPSV